MNLVSACYKDYLTGMKHKDIVFCDPPWCYDTSKLSDTQLNYQLFSNNYEEVKFILENVKCNYLFLWTTNVMIELCFDSYKNSNTNLKYKTLITWSKNTRKGNDFYGLGHTFRNSTEHIMVFQNVNAKAFNSTMRTIIYGAVGDRTIKPKHNELNIFNVIPDGEHAYIFSGPNIADFAKLKIDCVDICFAEDTEKFKHILHLDEWS